MLINTQLLKQQLIFLIASAVKIASTIIATLNTALIINLSENILIALNIADLIAYLLIMYFLIWIIQKVDRGDKIIYSLWIIIVVNILWTAAEYLSISPDFNLIFTVIMLITTIVFIYQALKVKTKELSYEFKLIGITFLVTKIIKTASPKIMVEANISEWVGMIQLLEILPIIAITGLIIKSFKMELK
jgi:hypothetical protein